MPIYSAAVGILSPGTQVLLTIDLAFALISYLEPRDLKAFLYSSLYASRFVASLTEVELDKYCERHAKNFPQLASTHGHFISSGCTCIMILASTHDIQPTDCLGSYFSRRFWSRDLDGKAIERAVRLGRWCEERRGYSARRFLAICLKEDWRTRSWWQRLWPRNDRLYTLFNLQQDAKHRLHREREEDEESIAVVRSLMPLA